MEYKKPEIVLMGDALEVIEASMDKNLRPVDSITQSDLTAAPAYEADE